MHARIRFSCALDDQEVRTFKSTGIISSWATILLKLDMEVPYWHNEF
jgi:hypothetical protein